MSKHTRWLFKELDRWTGGNIVTLEQAARIRALYPETGPGAPWGMIAFSGIGAVVVGLGVILLLAYNWQDIPRLMKLGLVLGATGAAHAGGLLLRRRGGWQAQLGEVLSLLGTMFFGAGIWLVAQIYHIEEHYPNGFLFWGLGALAMAWALASPAQGIVAAITLTIWGCSDVLSFDIAADVSSLLLAAGLGALAWRIRSALLLAVTVVGMHITLLAHASHWGGAPTGYIADLSLSTLLIALGLLVKTRPGFERISATMRIVGTAGFVACLYILTFEGAARDLLRQRTDGDDAFIAVLVYRWLPFALALVAWGWIVRRVSTGERDLVTVDNWLYPAALLFCQALIVTGIGSQVPLAVIVFNLAGFLLASMWMVHGCKSGSPGVTIAGSLLLAAIVIARFFDLFDSLAIRGLIFVILGAVLFAEGFYYRKLRREEANP